LLVVLCTFTLSNTDWSAINISDTLGGTYTVARHVLRAPAARPFSECMCATR
jgi:hypothetical protein